MTAMISEDVMTGREIHDAEQSEYIAALVESLFIVQDVADELARTHGILANGDIVTATRMIGTIRHKIRFALSAVDMETIGRQHPCTTCHGKPDHDSLYEPPNPCPACGL